MTRTAWMVVIAVLLGVLVGLGGFTFVYAKGYSYLGTDPAACANCHIMDEHNAAWLESSHRAAATCNDCHAPHDLVGKYAVKAKNGFWHSFYFTTGTYPYPLRITEPNHEVGQDARSGVGYRGGAVWGRRLRAKRPDPDATGLPAPEPFTAGGARPNLPGQERGDLRHIAARRRGLPRERPPRTR